MEKYSNKKNVKVNIIPLIDIIFLMLVFFMLATNFSENKQMSFKVQNTVPSPSESEQILYLKIIEDDYFIDELKIKQEMLNEEIVKKWKTNNFEKIIILNDDKSSIQKLIGLMDLLKKNNIKKVTFSDDFQK